MSADLKSYLESAQKIVIVVANNPDADSVGSALALREIFSTIGKEISLYCAIEIPVYLRFLANYEVFVSRLPERYDLAVMVDNSSSKLLASDEIVKKLNLKPLIILDHHQGAGDMKAELIIADDQMASTGEIIYNLSRQLNLKISSAAATYLAASISGDTLGFTSKAMVKNPRPLRTMADLVEAGADLHQLYLDRLHWQQLPASFIPLKGDLYKRIEFYEGSKIALLTVFHPEIKACSSNLNPTIILDEMRYIEGNLLTLGFKQYLDNNDRLIRVTLRIRSHHDSQISLQLAQIFDGGGHVYAAGAKWGGKELDFLAIKQKVIKESVRLLREEERSRAS